MDYNERRYEENENRLGAIINTLTDRLIETKDEVVSWTQYYMLHKMPSMDNNPLLFPFVDNYKSIKYLKMMLLYLDGYNEAPITKVDEDCVLSAEFLYSWLMQCDFGYKINGVQRVYDIEEDSEVFVIKTDGENIICDVPIDLQGTERIIEYIERFVRDNIEE